jgi:hypothetical protein
MKNIYDKKGVNKREFETPECIVRREFSPENGKLCSGSGMYGWFDKNNLPGRTTYVPTTEEESTTKKEDKTDNAESTTENTTQAEATDAPVTEAQQNEEAQQQ